MCTALERRLQVLLDEERHARLVRIAQQSGRSVGAVVRDAIDIAFPPGDAQRIEVARELLKLTATCGAGGEGPAELKAALAAELDEKLARA